MFEDIIGIIRSRKSENERQYNGKTKYDNKTSKQYT